MEPQFDFYIKCRACFSEEQDMHHLFKDFDQDLTLSQILKNLFPFEIKEDDRLSPYLCDNCTTVVIDFFNFKTVYLENEKYIKSLLNVENLKKTVRGVEEGKSKSQDKDCKTAMCGNKFDNCNAKYRDASGISQKLIMNNSHLADITEVFQDHSLNKADRINKEIQVTGDFVDPQDIVEEVIVTNDEIIIKQEENSNTAETNYCCQECGEHFLWKTQFLQHVHKLHKKSDQSNEHISNAIIENRKALKIKTKENTSLICNICKQEFKKSSDLETHYKVHKKFICEHCGIGFRKKSYLDDHCEVHTTERRHICPICGKAFRRRTVLVKHKRIHTHPRECVCEMCGLRFNNKGTLKTHIMLKHTKERNFPCTICGQWFPLKSTLDKHILRHNEQRERSFTCSICTMAYRDKSSLSRHVIIKHTDNPNRPSCKYCNKRYTTNTNLLKHIRKYHIF